MKHGVSNQEATSRNTHLIALGTMRSRLRKNWSTPQGAPFVRDCATGGPVCPTWSICRNLLRAHN
eukprot:6449235-Prorocentrum_lima.AAC.1